MSVVVYGIPTCDTVRKARRWLEAQGVAHTFVDFRATPPGRDTIAQWVAAFGASMRNTSGGAYRALPADKDDWSDEAWTTAFAADPMLIKRPVLTRDGAPVAVGFRLTPEAVAALTR